MYKYKETEEYVKAIAAYLKEKHGSIKESWKTLLKLIGNEFDTYQLAQQSITSNGILLEGAKGMYANPAIKISNDSLIQMQKLQMQLGITPSAEAKLSKLIAQKDDSDDFLDSLMK